MMITTMKDGGETEHAGSLARADNMDFFPLPNDDGGDEKRVTIRSRRDTDIGIRIIALVGNIGVVVVVMVVDVVRHCAN